MDYLNEQLEYNKISYTTLQPVDNDEKRLFWQFKLKGIRFSTYFYCILIACIIIFTGISLIINRDQISSIRFAASLVIFALWTPDLLITCSSQSYIVKTMLLRKMRKVEITCRQPYNNLLPCRVRVKY